MAIKKQKEIPISSYVKNYSAASKNGPAYLARGYIGEANDDTVRLYFDLSLNTYADIPRSSVLHVQQMKDDMHEQSELMLAGQANINIVHTQSRSVTAGDLQAANNDIERLKMAPPQANHPGAARQAGTDPCAKPLSVPDCGCSPGIASGHTASQPNEDNTARDVLRAAAKVALGPFGLLL